jgi:hypothetical protein
VFERLAVRNMDAWRAEETDAQAEMAIELGK